MKQLCRITEIKSIWSTMRGLITIELIPAGEIETYKELYFDEGFVYEKEIATPFNKATKKIRPTIVARPFENHLF